MNDTRDFQEQWRALYRMGASSAGLIALLLVGEVIVYAIVPRTETALEHFRLFGDQWLLGLLSLDLLGMIAYLLFIPLILALYMALRSEGAAVMLVATAVFFLGIADFFATNTAFSVLTLSQKYASATTDAERAMFLTAGQTMFTLFNENAFLVSYVLVSAAWAMIAWVMLRSPRFGRLTGATGIGAGISGILAVVLEHTSPLVLNAAIALYFIAMVLLLAWVLLIWRGLYRFSTAP